MAQEIERKYLLKGNDWRQGATGTRYRQGYLNSAKERAVRVRTIDDHAYLTIKGVTVGASRLEFEYEIPLADAAEMLATLCERPLIEKDRYKIEFAGLIWEVDEFWGENEGLLLAEVELEAEDQEVSLPAWIGQEVTGDPRYYNANLIKYPFSQWETRKPGA